jgi:arachidonate 15-lipoxygenase
VAAGDTQFHGRRQPTSCRVSRAEVREDHELQAWAAEVASPEGGAIRDFGASPGAIADSTDLAEILTMVIWTAGPQHAAVNFTQEEHLGYLPANPIAGFTEEPRGRDHELEDWLANLPPLDVAVQQLCVMRLLGVIHETKLGDYKDDFTQTPVADGLHGCREDLSAAEDEIIGRNRWRPQRTLRRGRVRRRGRKGLQEGR